MSSEWATLAGGVCVFAGHLKAAPISPCFHSGGICLKAVDADLCINTPRLCADEISQRAPGDYGSNYTSWASQSVLPPRKEPTLCWWWMALLIVSNWLLWKTLLWNTANLVTSIHCSALLILSHLAQALCNWKELHLCICGPTGSKDSWCKGMPVYKSKNTLIFIHRSVFEPSVHSNTACFNYLNVLTNVILITCNSRTKRRGTVAFNFLHTIRK